MFKYGRLRDRCTVAILCSLQVLVSIILVRLAIDLTANQFLNLHIFCWILQVSLGVSGLFGLFSLCVENSIVMIISKFLLIIVTVLLMIIALCMVYVALMLGFKHPALVWIAFIVSIIVAHIYATISASELVGAYRKEQIQTVPLKTI